jgi:hypothetical protein
VRPQRVLWPCLRMWQSHVAQGEAPGVGFRG